MAKVEKHKHSNAYLFYVQLIHFANTMALSGTESHNVLKRIVFIDRVLAFATDDIKRAKLLSIVTSSWKDSFDNYGYKLWKNIVYGIRKRSQNLKIIIDICEKGHSITILRNCIERGHLDINRSDLCEERSLLILASKEGKEDVLRILLDNGANKELCDIYGMRALHCACVNGNLGCIRILFDAGCEKNPSRRSPRHMAAMPIYIAYQNHHNHCVNFLLNKTGKEIDVPGNNGDTLMQTVIKFFEFELTKRMIPYVDVNIKDRYENTLLHLICSHLYKSDCAKKLIDAGVDKNAQNINGDTALHISCCHGESEMVKFLLSIGADFRIKNNKGDTSEEIVYRSKRINPKVKKNFTKWAYRKNP